MQVRFNQNLGTEDARCCSLDASKCTIGSVVDVSQDAFDWLTQKYVALVDVIEESPAEIVGVATEPKLKAPKSKHETK